MLITIMEYFDVIMEYSIPFHNGDPNLEKPSEAHVRWSAARAAPELLGRGPPFGWLVSPRSGAVGRRPGAATAVSVVRLQRSARQ